MRLGLKSLGRTDWTLLPPFVLGALLRVHQLPDQILVDDEWHAVIKLLHSNYVGILKDFGSADHCIPLTLFFKFLSDNLVLTEFSMRLPSLICGLAALIVLPLLAARWIGRRASVTMAYLLAVSPPLIYYSRLARPYAATLLLSFVALSAFQRWWTKDDGRLADRTWLGLYLACAIAACWLHAAVAPLVAAPFAFAAADSLRPSEGRNWKDLLLPAAALAMGLILLLGPPLWFSPQATANKFGAGSLEWRTFTGSLRLLAGTASTAPAVGSLLLSTIGAALLMRKRTHGVTCLLFAGAVQLLAVAVVRPIKSEEPLAFARYCLIWVPIGCLCAAAAIEALEERAAALRWPRGLAGPLLALGLLAAGPLPWLYRLPNNWTGQVNFQMDYRFDRDPLPTPANVSGFYDRLGQEPSGRLLLLEAPWHFYWHHFHILQRIHHQWMALGYAERDPSRIRAGEIPRRRKGIRFRNSFYLDDWDAIQKRGVDVVILHKDIDREMPTTFYPPDPFEMDQWIAEYRRTWGEPIFEDQWIAVFQNPERPALH